MKMAIDLKKLNLPSLVRKEVMDVTRKSKFPPEMTGNHQEAVLSYEYLPLEKGKGKGGKDVSARFQAKVRILESDNPMAAGREYTLAFWLGGDHQQYSDRERFAFVAACFRESADQFSEGLTEEEAKEKALEKEQELLNCSESNGFAQEADGTFPCRIYHTRTSKTKERAAIKEGKPVIETYLVANDYFSPIS
jgi:hypothetical protein